MSIEKCELEAHTNAFFGKWMKPLNEFVEGTNYKKELATKILEEYKLHQEGKDNAKILSSLINEAIELGILYPSSAE